MNPALLDSAPRLVVVVVNYRTPQLTFEAVRSVFDEARRLGGVIEVVDNDSGDGSFHKLGLWLRLAGMCDLVRLRQAPRNGGFGYGNNLVLREYLAHPEPPEAFYLLNPDARAEPGALTRALEHLAAEPACGAVGSQVLNEDKSVRRSAFRFHSVVGEFLRGARFGALEKALEPWVVAPEPPKSPAPVDWVSGAALALRRELLEEVGLFDEDYFLYYEEMDLCLRARERGWQVHYLPRSRVVHLCGQSTQVTGEHGAKRRPGYWFESRRRFFEKHQGGALRRAADVAWGAGMILRRALRGRDPEAPARVLRDLWDHARRPAPPAGPPPSALPDPQPLPSGAEDQNPDLPLVALLAEDLVTYDMNLFEPGFWAVAVHRFGNWRMNVPTRVLRAPFSLAYRGASAGVRWGWGIKLDYTVKLGRRVRIWHHGGIVLGAREIGDDVTIRQNTTLGVPRQGWNWDKPVVESGVEIGAGAVILGALRIGRGSRVGANAVVTRDVAAGATVVGVPARPLERRTPARQAPPAVSAQAA